MGIVAILVMWPGSFEQPYILPSQGESTCLTLIDQVVVEEMFGNTEDNIGRMDRRRMPALL